ncbi:hypothetical protein SCLCIDRAFT_1225077 [Scleroderma citrinum Foug A]|uniref:Uncharacterized protein n=1 Tax=Scleroderma citrinum Foug A TaxID=1036808 RepID=A0A0C2YM20_9AGAM|nr:hypothetical protein SCLCIDRAFT_1225077 [Scleroderma citrinum Foug A]
MFHDLQPLVKVNHWHGRGMWSKGLRQIWPHSSGAVQTFGLGGPGAMVNVSGRPAAGLTVQ